MVTDHGLLVSQSLPLRRICGHWHTVTDPKINRLSVLAFPPWGGTDWGREGTRKFSRSISLSWLYTCTAISLSHTFSCGATQQSSCLTKLCVHTWGHACAWGTYMRLYMCVRGCELQRECKCQTKPIHPFISETGLFNSGRSCRPRQQTKTMITCSFGKGHSKGLSSRGNSPSPM